MMLEVRQRNLKSFVFLQGEEEETMMYITKNFILLKKFLFIFTYPLSPSLRDFLIQKDLVFLESIQEVKLSTRDIPTIPHQITHQIEQKAQPTLFLQRTIRSGESIKAQSDITIIGNINSGAEIHSTGNIHIFGEINGNVFGHGEYMIVNFVNSGNIFFRGEMIHKDKLQGGAKKIYTIDETIYIEELA